MMAQTNRRSRVRWQRRRPQYHLRIAQGITPGRRAAIRSFVAWYRKAYPARHYIAVEAYASRRFGHTGDLPEAIGLFWYPNHPRTSRYSPKVYLAARNGSIDTTLHVLAHELSHYAEWARTGWSTERGKNQRADALLRQYAAQRTTGRS